MSGDVIGEALAIPFKREPYIDIPTISACPILWQEGIIVGRPKQLDRKTMQLPKHLQRLNLNAAGIDIGSKSHFVAVPEGTDDEPVREFECFTADLYRLADWLISCGVTTVAMESTGTYWIPVFEILESLNIEVKLVNARHVKNVPGRKTDVLDCQWIQQLHTYGLLEGAFRPPEQICELRAYIRHRMNQVRYSSAHIQHMQKALTQMNLLLHNVVSDITGVTGMRIIKAILDGERDTQILASMRDKRCKNSIATIAKSLQGNYRPEHLFSLKQAVEALEFYEAQIAECDREIESLLASFDSVTKNSLPSQPEEDNKSSKSQCATPAFNLQTELCRVAGVDLTKIDGIDTTTALKIVSETGFDMSRWKSAKHFASWLGLSPGSKISGGKSLSGKTKPVVNRAAIALRMAASSLYRSSCALGAYYRRMKARLGAPKAITATAHKLARLVYSMLKYGTDYTDVGQEYYEQRYKSRVIQNLKKRAQQLGYELVETMGVNKKFIVTQIQ
ncbi:MAG: Transposase IS116/IS110/IS902 family protein [Spirochaetes bacterium ADurb.Bin001]|jgi:transposase|nr:MAG: Transposase IS116/IS110/IS902 family protein [Spirochaetes bacterium ADurb.Bin001]